MKTVVVVSGGLDSTVLLHKCHAEDPNVLALSIRYGQRHARELEHAAMAAKRLGVPHEVLDVRAGLGEALKGSALTSDNIPVPLGHYEDESMKATVVPNRNMLLLAIAGSYAISHGAGRLAYGAHAGDHAIYPDCRPDFVDAMDEAFGLCDWKPLELHAPFLFGSKAEIVLEGARLGVAMETTWSCYQGGDLHCGRCGTCVERREAFERAGVQDLTQYQEVSRVAAS